MATVRYQVDEAPQDGTAHAWFPVPGLTPAGQSSIRRFIHGYPGTMRVPSPRPRFDQVGAHLAGGEYRNSSDVAPDWFAPQIWWNDINELPVAPTSSGRGVKYLPHRTAVVPPPVGKIDSLLEPPKVAMGGRKIGTRRSMHWPRIVPRWPNLSGRYE